jgi:DNA-binding response OmpR family regulator
MSGREQVLVVDDDPLVARLVRLHLDRAGYRVRSAATGQQALDSAIDDLPDLVILDLMLPDLDGYDVCRQLREFSLVPVILLTAKGEQVDKLRGFELGADDYLTKPFAPQELLARVRAVLRRSQQAAAPATPAIVQCGDISIDMVRRRVTARGEVVKLTPTEFRLLQQLAVNAGKVLPHEKLLTEVWGSEYRDDRDYLWAYVRRLRRKLEVNPESPVHIRSETGFGYLLDCSRD